MGRVSFSFMRWAGLVCLVLSLMGLSLGQAKAASAKKLMAAATDPAAAPASAEPVPASAPPLVPQLINFSGTLTDLAGKAIAGPADVTFSLYAEQSDGEPLWYESQTVSADARGRYTALLGSMTPGGVPMSLFASGEARWLGVMVRGLPEQPRVLLVSVPYAMTSGNAEMLGGKPASDYLLAGSSSTALVTTGSTSGSGSSKPMTTATPNATISGTQNYLPVFTDNSGSLGNSLFYQSGSNIGLGTTSPGALLTVGSPVSSLYGVVVGSTSQDSHLTIGQDSTHNAVYAWKYNSTASSGSAQLVTYGYSNPFFIDGSTVALQSQSGGNVGIGTALPSTLLTVGSPVSSLYGVAVGSTTQDSHVVVGQDSTHNSIYAWKYNPTASSGSAQLVTYGYSNPFFIDGSTVALQSQSGGKVGIGTNLPAYTLDVAGTIHASGSISGDSPISATGSGGNSAIGGGTIDNGGTIVSGQITALNTQANGIIGETTASGYLGGVVGISTNSTAAGVSGQSSGTDAPAVQAIATGTSANGVAAQATGGGNAIYATAGGASTVAGDFVGDVDVSGNLTVTGYVSYNGGCVGTGCPSDERLKKDIRPFALSLDKLAELQPVRFNWRDANPAGYPSNSVRQTGFIAQQVKQVFPAMVSKDKNGYYRVNYSLLPFMLLSGVKELKTRNDDLAFEVQAEATQIRRARTEITRLRDSGAARNAQIALLRRQVEQLQRTSSAVATLEARLNRDEAQEKATRAKLAREMRHEKKASRTELVRMQL